MSDLGIQASTAIPVSNPLPLSWLGRPDMPSSAPVWANINALSNTEVRNLLAQISYDLSGWDYTKVGSSNQLGRYQFSTQILEVYGLLATGSNAQYGTNCVNYTACWKGSLVNASTNNYQNYIYSITSLSNFLTTQTAQEHLAYQRIVDIYLTCKNIGSILDTDTPDVVAGMIYVAWTLSVGSAATTLNPNGTGSWAWRYHNLGNGANSFNSGRYSYTVLSS
jgi:hypothetical protein